MKFITKRDLKYSLLMLPAYIAIAESTLLIKDRWTVWLICFLSVLWAHEVGRVRGLPEDEKNEKL